MLNYELFRVVVAPNFASMSNSELDLFAEQAACELSREKWGDKYDRALALLTAHAIELSKRNARSGDKGSGGATGELKRTKVGQLEREYSVSTNSSGKSSEDTYSLTLFGKEYIRLRRQILRGPIFVRGCY